MLGKCVRDVSNDSHMNAQTNLFCVLFWGLRAASLTEVALCPLWKRDPLRCAHALWTSARKKAGGWRPGEGVGKRLENERTVEKRSGLQAFLCDYTSVEKEARHSFSPCLKLLASTLDPCSICERETQLWAFPNSSTFVLARTLRYEICSCSALPSSLLQTQTSETFLNPVIHWWEAEHDSRRTRQTLVGVVLVFRLCSDGDLFIIGPLSPCKD